MNATWSGVVCVGGARHRSGRHASHWGGGARQSCGGGGGSGGGVDAARSVRGVSHRRTEYQRRALGGVATNQRDRLQPPGKGAYSCSADDDPQLEAALAQLVAALPVLESGVFMF